jgi:hypothetical protein
MSNPRTYRLDNTTYQGFDKNFSTPHKLVLVQVEDIVECWAIDGKDIAIEIFELFHYLNEFGQAQIIGIYQEDGFRGVICQPEMVSPKSRWK